MLFILAIVHASIFLPVLATEYHEDNISNEDNCSENGVQEYINIHPQVFSPEIFDSQELEQYVQDKDLPMGIFDRYGPKVLYAKILPEEIQDRAAHTEVQIFTRVNDVYGTIRNATLSYSINNGTDWNKTEMELINGRPSNGTYL
jgi:hypothetical protein